MVQRTNTEQQEVHIRATKATAEPYIYIYIYTYTEWNITVGHRSLTDQLHGVHDQTQFCFDRTYLHDCTFKAYSYCMDGRESMSNPKSRQLTEAGKIELVISRCVSAKRRFIAQARFSASAAVE